MDPLLRTERTQVRRLPNRGNYERQMVNEILQEGLVCHVGFVADGSPFVIPTGYGVQDDSLYIHGSTASRMIRTLSAGAEACITVTLHDGVVLARSVFHHSMNYRSVVLFGRGRLVDSPAEKLNALRIITDHLVPGRWADARPPSDLELKATSVIGFPLLEASAKVRTGPPADDEEDYSLPIWAGVLPLAVTAGEPVPDARNLPEASVPDYVQSYKRLR